MKELWILLGLTSMILGVIGIVLPVLPTTPFFLLTTYSFTKGSSRFHRWFRSIPFVQKYLTEMVMTKRKKWTLLLTVDAILIIYMVVFNNFIITVMLTALILVKHVVFHKYVTVR